MIPKHENMSLDSQNPSMLGRYGGPIIPVSGGGDGRYSGLAVWLAKLVIYVSSWLRDSAAINKV